MTAATYGHTDLVRILIDHGANIDAKHKLGMSHEININYTIRTPIFKILVFCFSKGQLYI